MTHIQQFLPGLRRVLSGPKRKLVHRLVYPTRYLRDLALVQRTANGAPDAPPIRMLLLSDKDAYCSEEQFHPFVDPANVTPPSTPAAPALKKHHRANAKCERGTEASPRPPKNIWPQLSDFPAAVRP